VDFNLIVDRAWPRFLSKAYAFVKHVDDPDIVAEVLECLASGDCTGVGEYFPFTTFRRLIAHTRLTLFFYNQVNPTRICGNRPRRVNPGTGAFPGRKL